MYFIIESSTSESQQRFLDPFCSQIQYCNIIQQNSINQFQAGSSIFCENHVKLKAPFNRETK